MQIIASSFFCQYQAGQIIFCFQVGQLTVKITLFNFSPVSYVSNLLNHNIWHFILQDLNYWASFLKDKNCPKSNYKLFGPTPKRWKVCHYVSSMKPISIKDHLGSSMNEFCPRETSEFGLHRGFNWQIWRCINLLKYVITIKYECNNS